MSIDEGGERETICGVIQYPGTAKKAERSALKNHASFFMGMISLLDSQLIALVSEDKINRLWDVATGAALSDFSDKLYTSPTYTTLNPQPWLLNLLL